MNPDSHRENILKDALLPDLSDGELLHRWKLGNETAASLLLDRYSLRLVALVASRLNRRFRDRVDPDDIVQSAMGSFFDAARHSRIEISESVSLWRLMATFVRRKMTRAIERHSAGKRGGDLQRVSLDVASEFLTSNDEEACERIGDEFLAGLRTDLPEDLFVVLELLLSGKSQVEIAADLSLNERTIRRRVQRIREMLSVEPFAKAAPGREQPERSLTFSTALNALPRVDYHQFVLAKLIGSGGFGKVYRAAMQGDGSAVAVKFLRKAFWKNDVARESFLREIDVASQISHPGVIRYLGWGQSPHGGPYVISEWINGVTLDGLDNRTYDYFIGLFRQICNAMADVHAAGLVHGDLTPRNIMVNAQGRIVITDFGLSMRSGSHLETPVGGTPGFAAPEQLSPAFGRISTRTDIYALGGLVHWHLTGRAPNHHSAIASILQPMRENIGLRLDQVIGAPANLVRVATACLSPHPSERPDHVDEVLAMLDSV